jgi:hypothetical protein
MTRLASPIARSGSCPKSAAAARIPDDLRVAAVKASVPAAERARITYWIARPDPHAFRLTAEEVAASRSQLVTLNSAPEAPDQNTAQRATPRGANVRYLPYAFTEQGVSMLSSVLRSPRAVHVNIEIMRTFVRLRQALTGHAELSRKLDELEARYDSQFRAVFDAIRQLMTPPSSARHPIGFVEPDSGHPGGRTP